MEAFDGEEAHPKAAADRLHYGWARGLRARRRVGQLGPNTRSGSRSYGQEHIDMARADLLVSLVQASAEGDRGAGPEDHRGDHRRGAGQEPTTSWRIV